MYKITDFKFSKSKISPISSSGKMVFVMVAICDGVHIIKKCLLIRSSYLHTHLPFSRTKFIPLEHLHLKPPGRFSHTSPVPLHEKLPIKHSLMSSKKLETTTNLYKGKYVQTYFPLVYMTLFALSSLCCYKL